MRLFFDPSRNDDTAAALRVINERASNDPRVEAVMLALCDSLRVVRKR